MLQDKYHLYFLFDLMAGGDLMDVLVAEAKVIKRRIPQGAWRRACFAPKVRPRVVRSRLPWEALSQYGSAANAAYDQSVC